MNSKPSSPPRAQQRPKRRFARLRGYFLGGLAIAAPALITIYTTIWVVELVDDFVIITLIKPLLPEQHQWILESSYVLPGIGLALAIPTLILLGIAGRNFLGARLIRAGEWFVRRAPFVGVIYSLARQVFDAIASPHDEAFRAAALLEYPRPGIWAVVFVSRAVGKDIQRASGEQEQLVSVFLPTTPNPTSGFLLFVPRSALRPLSMPPETAARVIVSAGVASPDDDDTTH